MSRSIPWRTSSGRVFQADKWEFEESSVALNGGRVPDAMAEWGGAVLGALTRCGKGQVRTARRVRLGNRESEDTEEFNWGSSRGGAGSTGAPEPAWQVGALARPLAAVSPLTRRTPSCGNDTTYLAELFGALCKYSV